LLGAHLRDANLSAAGLAGADLKGAHLQGATSVGFPSYRGDIATKPETTDDLSGVTGHCCVDRNAAAFGLAGSAASEAQSQFVESSADTLPSRAVVGDPVVAATKVLHEGVTGCHDAH